MSPSTYFKEHPILMMIITILSAWGLMFSTRAYNLSDAEKRDFSIEMKQKADIEYVKEQDKEVKEYVNLRVNTVEIKTQTELNNIKVNQRRNQEFLENNMDWLRDEMKFIRERLD